MATGNRLSTEIMINLAGNLTAKARQYGANMSQFARNHQKAMRLVKATTEAAGRGLDTLGNRYTAMIAGLGSSLTIKQVADFDAQMRRMGTDAQLTTEQVKTLHDKIRDVSNQKIFVLMPLRLVRGPANFWGKQVIISMWWTTCATWGCLCRRSVLTDRLRPG